jgi:hypothetical protein
VKAIMRIVIIFFLLLNLRAQAQNTGSDSSATDYPDKWIYNSTVLPCIEPTFSLFYFSNPTNQKSALRFSKISSDYKSVGINFNLNGFGDLGFLGLIPSKELCIMTNYFLPVSNNYNDTVNEKYNGYNFSINYGKDLFYKNRTIDIIPYYGYGFGKIELKSTSNSETRNFNNAAFFFNFMCDFRLNLIQLKKRKLVCIGARSGYQIDISNPNWRINKKLTNEIPHYKQTGYYFQAFASLFF